MKSHQEIVESLVRETAKQKKQAEMLSPYHLENVRRNSSDFFLAFALRIFSLN